MFAPGIHQGIRVPGRLLPFALALSTVAGVVAAWAVLDAQTISSEHEAQPGPTVNAANIRSIAYVVPEATGDVLYVRPVAAAAPRPVAWFPASFSLHARGSASPTGERLAVIHVSASPGTSRMTLVDVNGGRVRDIEVAFDHYSALSWTPDGRKLAATHSSTPDETGRVTSLVFEVDVATGATEPVARFEQVLEAHPVGYSSDGRRLFMVVVDQTGSSLWEQRAGHARAIGRLSAGRTRDWQLSPDGARLAFVDVLGAGAERSYAGKVMLTATGAVTDMPGSGDQVGAAWQPRSDVPAFGGPGGSLRLTGDAAAHGYVVPAGWSPDGSALVATVYPGESVPGAASSLEVVWDGRREPLTDAVGATFLGWVKNSE